MTTLLETLLLFALMTIGWRSYKKSMRDLMRDQIFKARDSWRVFYTDNGYAFDDGVYSSTRTFINSCLHNIGRFRLSSFFFFASQMTPELRQYVKEKVKLPADAKADVVKKAVAVENDVVDWLVVYMAATTLWFFPVFVVILCYVSIKSFLRLPKTVAVKKSAVIFSTVFKKYIPSREEISETYAVAC